MTTALLALTLFAIMVAALRVMPKVRRGQPWSPEKAIDARPHLRIADDRPEADEDKQAWDARFKRWQERPTTIAADDPEIPRLLERGHYEEP
jgi:hypothetical protein